MTKGELENKLEQTEKALADYQFNHPSIKELEQENAALKNEIVNLKGVIESLSEQRDGLEKENFGLKGIVKHLYEGLDKLYLGGLSEKQIALIEQLQDKAEQFLQGRQNG